MDVLADQAMNDAVRRERESEDRSDKEAPNLRISMVANPEEICEEVVLEERWKGLLAEMVDEIVD